MIEENITQRSCRTGDRQHIQEHLANERTFLSWIRTAVAILAFGFVMEKFSVYLRILERQAEIPVATTRGAATYLGAFMCVVAGLVVILASARYWQVRRQIDRGAYRHSVTADLLLAAMLILVTVLVSFYLLRSSFPF